jgi:hypothetical protein
MAPFVSVKPIAQVALALGMSAALGGCAREALPPELPGSGGQALPWPAAMAARQGAPLAVHARPRTRGLKSLGIPDGDACLAWLTDHDVAFHSLSPKPGMATPIAVTGPIGGVRYETAGAPLIVCDCRLAVALGEIGPELQAFGITEVHHSGAYVYRTTRAGRPSLHALGLAIDVHQLRTTQHNFDVLHDYVRGTGPSCKADSPTLNRLACELDRTGLFQQVITPDDDSDHRDHLHLAIRARNSAQD